MVRVKALIDYNDYELKKLIKANEEYSVTDERAKVLLEGNKTNGYKPFVEVVEEVIETAQQKMPDVEVAVKPRRKKAIKD